MGWHLDGKVTAVVGTHTHVQTADERILPKGTAYLTDVGMTGPHDSVIGVEIEPALGRFRTGMPAKFETATGNPRLNAVVIDADEQTGRATDIERLSYSLDELQQLTTCRWRICSIFRLKKTTRPSVSSRPVERRRRLAPVAPTAVAARRRRRRASDRSDRHRADRPRSRSARRRVLRGLGRGRAVELQDLEHRPSLLHAEGCGDADPRFMFRSALRYLKFKPADGLRVVARGKRHGLRAEGRISARLRAPRAARTRRAAARLRTAEEAAAGGRTVRRGAQTAAAGAAAQDRHRHVARRRRDPRHHQGAAAALSRTRTWSSGRRGCRARMRRSKSRGACGRSRACRASTWSSSAAAADRLRISGRSTRKSSRARSRGCRCRSSRRSATRPT